VLPSRHPLGGSPGASPSPMIFQVNAVAWMGEIRMWDGELIPIVALSLVFGIPVVSVVAHYACQAWRAWLQLSLKREMVAHGYSAQEIVEVLGAKTGGAWQSEPPATRS
jgi:hypothetical protein